MKRIAGFAALALMMFPVAVSDACTGISLVSQDGSRVVARTMDMEKPPMQWGYVVSPRGQIFRSSTPEGENGLRYLTIYGFVGIFADHETYIVEGINESGLSAGQFCLSDTDVYSPYMAAAKERTVCDRQMTSWILSQFSSIDQVEDALEQILIVSLDDGMGEVCWRIAEPNGRMAVIEIVDGVPRFHETRQGMPELQGDNSFVRAAFIQSSASKPHTGTDTVMQAFRILNNFDTPDETQFTSATDQTAMKFYFRTALNSNIRCLDLMEIDFKKVRYQSRPLDIVRQQPVEMLKVK